MASLSVAAGWYRPARNALSEWRKAHGGEDPSEGVKRLLAAQIAKIKEGMARHEELTFEHHHEVLSFVVKNGRNPTGYPSNDRGENRRLVGKAMATVDAHVKHYEATHPSFFSQLNPAKLISAAADVISTVAPFVDMAIRLVPGAGQLYSVAKGAIDVGVALAKGRPITDAFLNAAVGAIPGGAIAQRAARAVVSLAKGRSLTGELLDQVKEQFPGAEHAITVAAGIVHGRKLQDIAVEEVKGLASSQLSSLKLPVPMGVEVPPSLRSGAELAMGVLKNSKLPNGASLTPAAALAIRARLPKVDRAGFDHIMSLRALRNLHEGSPRVPRPKRPLPPMRGATFVTADGKAVVLQ